MTYLKNEVAFCVLALGQKYRLFTKILAQDLENYAPTIPLVVGTDQPNDFADCKNVLAFQQFKQGILHCYHDKRFVIERTLSQFQTAIQIDADTRLTHSLPEPFNWIPGITAGHLENLANHIKAYNPERFNIVQMLASKLGVSLDDALYVGESLFVITRDDGKERAFIEYWHQISRYLELRGIHSGEGAAIGLAAAKAGLKIMTSPSYENLHSARKHLGATGGADQKARKAQKQDFRNFNFKEYWQRKLSYHYRLNRSRLDALRDFDFYYR
jgi:hypothetical protein